VATIASEDLTRLNRVALELEYRTVGRNGGEAVLTIGLGAAASSLALIGSEAVSIVEVFASGVVVWHLLPGHAVSNPARTAELIALSPSLSPPSRPR